MLPILRISLSILSKLSNHFPANFDDDDASADEETTTYVNKEVDEGEKEGEKYPQGRPNSFLNRMISHGNKKTEDELARDKAEYDERERVKRQGISAGQPAGAAQATVGNQA